MLVRNLEQQLRLAPLSMPLTLVELSVLNQVDHGIDRPSLLARALQLDPARVTHLTDHLVALGCLERLADLDDRRSWLLSVTEGGDRSLAEGRRVVAEIMNALLDQLLVEERTGLEVGLLGIRRILDTTVVARR
jgi:DNA-binding MarR family transcriptional regulator